MLLLAIVGKCCPHSLKSWPCFFMPCLCTHLVHKMCRGIQKWYNTEYFHVLSSWIKSVGNKEVWFSSLSIFNFYLQMNRMTCLETICTFWQWNSSWQSLLKMNMNISHQESGTMPQKRTFTLQVGPAHFSIGHGGDYVLGQQPDEEWPCQVKECQMAFFPSRTHYESWKKSVWSCLGLLRVPGVNRTKRATQSVNKPQQSRFCTKQYQFSIFWQILTVIV